MLLRRRSLETRRKQAYNIGVLQPIKKLRILGTILILAVLLAISIFAWAYVKYSVEQIALARFEEQINNDVAKVQSNLNFYVNALYSAQIFYEAHPSASQKEFSNYFARLIMPDVYPGILAMAFVERVESGGTDKYLIKYSESLVGKSAIGIDLYALADRKGIIDKARDTGRITATSKVMLLVWGENMPGAVLFVPIYKAGVPHETVEERREAIIGVLNTVISTKELFGNVFTKDRGIALEVFDGTKIDEKELYYDSDEGINPFGAYKPRFALEKYIEVADRTWTLNFYTLDEFQLSFFTEYAPPFTLAIGILLSLLITYVIYSLSAAKEKALVLVESKTKELKLTNELLQSEKENIRKSEEKYRNLVDTMAEGLGVQDKNGLIVFMNRRGCEMLGYNLDELLGKPVEFLFDEDNKKILHEQMQKRKNGINQSYEIAWRRKDGSSIDTIISPSPRFDEKGNLAESVAVFTDITREKEIDRAKSEFVSLASHQLRTPLTGMEWTIELFSKKEKLTKMGREYLNNIYLSARRLSLLIKLLLNVSRIESGNVGVEPEPLDLVASIGEYIKENKILCEKGKISLVFTKHPKNLLAVTDKNLFGYIVRNLLSNSINYTPAGGSIEIILEAKKGTAILMVRDTGIGIPKNEQSRIFQKFIRASNASAAKPDGNGLGLYIVKKSVDLLGGKIWFESPVPPGIGGEGGKGGNGTIFFFEFPLKAEPHPGEKGLVLQNE